MATKKKINEGIKDVWNKTYGAPKKPPVKFVVTAKVKISGKRDAISKPMNKQQADAFAKRLRDDMEIAIPEYKMFSDIKVEVDKPIGENKMAKKKEKLDEGMVMMASLLPVGQLIGMPPKRKDNFVFKGLPGQFDKNGVKVLDEYGDPIKEEKLNDDFNSQFLNQSKEDRIKLQNVQEILRQVMNSSKKYSKSTAKKVEKLHLSVMDIIIYLNNELK